VPRPQRTRLLLLCLLAVGVAWLGWLAWRADTTLLRRRLVRDIRALARAEYPRAVQTPPVLPGRFGARAADAWTALAQLEGNSLDVEFCRAVRDGEAAVQEAPESCLRELSQGEAALGRLLQATHAEAAGPPLGLGALDVPSPKEDARTFVTAGYAARMAALRLREELAAGQADGAVSTCLDVLGLARDTGWGTGLEGRLAGLTVAAVAFGPCAAALDAASLPSQRQAGLALSRISQGTPPLSETLSEWSTAVRAHLFAPYLKEALPTLPEAVRAWALERAVPTRAGLTETVVFGSAWHSLQSRLDAAVEAARLPWPQAASRLHALSASKEAAFQALGRLDFPDLGSVALSDAHARTELLLLRRAAEVGAVRAETGAWPRPEALPAELRSSAAAPFTLEDRGTEAVLLDATSARGPLEVHLHAAAQGKQ
jgi:hypothetical protein